jgi:hypothetical protein
MKPRIATYITAMTMFVLLAVSSSLRAQEQQDDRGHYHGPRLIQFDPPGVGKSFSSTAACQPTGCGTQAFSNNAEGAIVGFYTDENVVPHGFLRTPDGQFVSFDAPGAGLGAGLDQGTVAISINDLGVIAGQFEDDTNVFHAFVRYPNGSFTTIDAPGAGQTPNQGQGTIAFNINLEGEIAGIYIDVFGTEHGFVRSPRGEITAFDPPTSISTMVCEETCLSPEGVVAGFYLDSSFTSHGFLRERNGNITTFDAPGAGMGAFEDEFPLGTEGASINFEGMTAGVSLDPQNVGHGFLRTLDNNFTMFNVPGAGTSAFQGTFPFSINLFGAATGVFVDSKNVSHGFSRSARGNFVAFDAPDAGKGANQGTRPSTNNAEGAVAGWFVDTSNVNHGFAWIPGNFFSDEESSNQDR